MLTPLCLAMALAMTPGQAPALGPLALTNVRSTYGELGGPRPVTPLIPGDVLFVGFDIENIATDAEGRVKFSMFMEVTDAAGASKYKTDPANRDDFLPLGGNRLPARAFTAVGFDQPPGDYVLKVTVTDLATKSSKTVEQKFTVLPKAFGVVAVYASVDDRGSIPIATTGMVGQPIFVQLAVVGFARGADKRPNFEVEMVPLDEKGNPTVAKPNALAVQGGVDEKDPAVAVRFLVPLTRAGKYTIRLKATDKLTNQTATFNLPLTALPNN